MARRPMRRRSARRSGRRMLVVNPRRRAKKATAKRRTAKRRNPRRIVNRKKRKTKKRKTTTKKRVMRRRNPRAKSKVKVKYRYRKPRKIVNKRKKKRKSNPKFNLMGSIKKGIGAITGSLFPAIFGALSIEPTMMVGGLVSMIPGVSALPTSVFYGLAGMVSAGVVTAGMLLVRGLGLKIDNSTIKAFAAATAAAGGGVGYYKFRTGQDTDLATEMGLLTLNGAGLGLLTLGGHHHHDMSGMLTVHPHSMGDPGAYYVHPLHS